MIKKLINHVDKDKYGNIYGEFPISNNEMRDKINEIIDYINGKKQVLLDNKAEG